MTDQYIKKEIIARFDHSWRVFEKLVQDFADEDWNTIERDARTAAEWALHIFSATNYYLEDWDPIVFASGISVGDPDEVDDDFVYPSQEDIIQMVPTFQKKIAQWVLDMDLAGKNDKNPWAGETKLGVALFLFSHSIFHIGELASLLNESKNGDAKDHFGGEA